MSEQPAAVARYDHPARARLLTSVTYFHLPPFWCYIQRGKENSPIIERIAQNKGTV